MKILFSLAILLLGLIPFHAHGMPPDYLLQKIISQGVPEDALLRLMKFMDENKGRGFSQEVYMCLGKDPGSVVPCNESKRIPITKTVVLESPENVAIVDYGAAATEYRFFLINLLTGDVTRYYSAHGIGSGKDNFAFRFSNLKDSRQTSLGIYLAGEVYRGHYGNTLRMYGLQGSNDQAYNRDIVLHGAWYVSDKFINSRNPTTGQRYGRLGLSWGCPAVPLESVDRIIQTLSNGGLVMHYRDSLMEEALSGREVRVPNSSFK